MARDQGAVEDVIDAQRLEHSQLVTGQLQVYIELDAGERLGRKMRQPLLERMRRTPGGVRIVVGKQQPVASLLG